MTELATESSSSKLAIVAPYDSKTLQAISTAKAKGLIEPILIGNKSKILSAIKGTDLNIAQLEIIATEQVEEAAKKAVKLVSDGEAEFVMKGLVSTAKLLQAVLNEEYGLRTDQLLSYVGVLEISTLDRLLITTDPAMNIAPNLKEKIQITENAIQVAQALEVDQPKVAVVGAVEKVKEKMPATMDAAVLSKMADRGQIKGAVIDGPLAFDNAISQEAKEIKGIESEVAGEADIIVVPRIEVGNVLYKSLTHLAGAQVGGVVIGATTPVVLSSRADSAKNKLNSIILGKVVAQNEK